MVQIFFALYAIYFYNKKSYKKQLIDFELIKNEDPLNFLSIGNDKIMNPTSF